MKFQRLYHSLMLALSRGSSRRANYLRKHKIFAHVGEGTTIMCRTIPLYPNLIKLHDNVHLASGVRLITHDISHVMVNRAYGVNLSEKVGCIEIMDNVYIGAHATIMPGVRIGPNAIVGAGSIVTKDIPSNCVAVGIPAKPIMSLDAFREKRSNVDSYPPDLRPRGQICAPELAAWMWNAFERRETTP